MQVALMIPCYVDLFYPEVGVATLELLEKLKVDVVYPFDQTCCGQPMANSGCYEEAQATEELFIKNFSAFDHIVTPSGSCTHHLRHNFSAAPDSPERRKISASVYDLVEFLHDVLPTPAIFLPVLFLVVALASYQFGQLGARQVPYAYFLLGLTTLTVATDGVTDPAQAWQIGLDRSEEILVGIMSSPSFERNG
jgi:Cysteine-rich domain